MKNHEGSFTPPITTVGAITHRYGLLISTVVLLLLSVVCANAQQRGSVVRLAEIKIDPSRLENYLAALKEEIETSIRAEPGVLTLYAVAEKDDPSRITVFEIYANEEAYRSHLETPHFKKYKATTKEMVTSLKLKEVSPIVLGSKGK